MTDEAVAAPEQPGEVEDTSLGEMPDLVAPTDDAAEEKGNEAAEQVTDESAEAERQTEPSDFDKTRQQIQQEIGNKVRPLEEKFDALLERLDKKPDEKPATPAEVDELDALIQEAGETYDDPKFVELLTTLASKVKAVGDQKPTLDDESRELLEQVKVQQAQAAHKTAWQGDNPDIAGDYDKLVAKAWKDAADAGFPGSPEAAGMALARLTRESKEAAKTATTKPSDTPPKSTRGTKQTIKGATATEGDPPKEGPETWPGTDIPKGLAASTG